MKTFLIQFNNPRTFVSHLVRQSECYENATREIGGLGTRLHKRMTTKKTPLDSNHTIVRKIFLVVEGRLLSTVLVKLAYYAPSKALFLWKKRPNYVRFTKLCYLVFNRANKDKTKNSQNSAVWNGRFYISAFWLYFALISVLILVGEIQDGESKMTS